MMELLSPAGSKECLVAAVQNGADAVYFGGSILNARRFADNFAGDGLVSALDYCHERGVKAYITLNTLVFDREIDEALGFAEQLYRYSADAVLVQDLGLARLLRHYYPDLTLHASTQMGIHDKGGLRYCESLGMKRAVLAREVSLREIAYLSENSNIELEAFGHGALCMSFSGSCLYSSMAGERSGNRGTCAQPCRKAASVLGKPGANDFCLSPNDICMIEHLDELEKAGVCCIKLEGRMKKPEYVAAVTSCYRAALDGADKTEIALMKQEMFRFFNRGEFSTSHMFKDSVRTDRVGSSKPEKADVASANESFSSENRKRPIDMRLTMKPGKNAVLSASCEGKTVESIGETVQLASKEQTKAVYEERLSKLGNTPFRLETCEIDMTADCYISSANLNALRRNATNALSEAFRIRNEYSRNPVPYKKHPANAGSSGNRFIYSVLQTAEAAESAFLNGSDIVAIEPGNVIPEELKYLRKYCVEGKKLLIALPNVLITSAQHEYVKTLLKPELIDGAEANNIGQIELIKHLDLKIAGIGLNALNTFTVSELLEKGFDYVVPSQELTSKQLQLLTDEYGGRMILWLHGRVPLMQLLHCPVKEHKGCLNCNGDAGSVTDESGRSFPLSNIHFPDKCLVRMMNCSPTDLVDRHADLPKTAGFRLSFAGEPISMISERLTAAKHAMNGKYTEQYPGSTRGHWNRKVD